MKKLWEKIKKWIKSFYIKNQVIILKVLNYLVLFSIYGLNSNPYIEMILGIYIMFLIGMDAFKIFMKKQLK